MFQSSKVGDYLVSEKGLIGVGAYSRVYMGQSSTGGIAAIKKVKKSTRDMVSYKLAKKQASILTGLHSRYSTQLIGTYEQEDHYYLIQKYYQGKTLAKILQEKKTIPFPEALSIFKSILKSLEYLASKNIMHRDLKPQNMIYHNGKITIIDFGFACKIDTKDEKVLVERIGTPIYMSPQILSKMKYNSKSDIWSLGVVLFEMMNGCPPFCGKSDSQILSKIKKSNKISFKQIMLPAYIKNLVMKCLTVDVDKRISWKQLFQWRKTAKNTDIAYEKNEQLCCLCFC